MGCATSTNHLSAGAGLARAFPVDPFGMMYEEITASSLIKIDLKGNIIANANPNIRSTCRAT
jgi:ribulose-5-phosphate 4-epimerase/fuculose-1-phosphate aldolase